MTTDNAANVSSIQLTNSKPFILAANMLEVQGFPIHACAIRALITLPLAANDGVDRKMLDLAQEYLAHGGVFNPEMMAHEKVRDMVIGLRDSLIRANHRAIIAERATMELRARRVKLPQRRDIDCGPSGYGIVVHKCQDGFYMVADDVIAALKAGGWTVDS